ncbi:unnamed protein product [Phytophthora lilii]|uniref:Unnamed protein product n=1 Tax=Phytophthora lilii TaxID=2077276 RepID=A0A9W6WK49_9STRA|nr:unnamed protein product [Phytophthora lilii]
MPAEKRHVAGLLGEQEALGTNWKSAQCVTSLYDSYIQLQRENEELREETRRLKQENELRTMQGKQDKLREPEDTRTDELEQEVRLLRSEKLRMEEAHRLELQKLETRAASSEMQHQQLVTKYQERFEFDPLESKRAAMAVKTMQNTLQNVVLEKEELGIRFGELKEQYRKFHREQTEIVRDLKEKIQVFEQQRVRVGRQRVVNALAMWSTNKVQSAWSKWVALAREKRKQEENNEWMISLEHKADERISAIQGNQAAKLAMKLLQQTARRAFFRWREIAWLNLERRRKGTHLADMLSRRSIQRTIRCWHQESQKAKTHRTGLLRLERLLTCHSRHWGMRKWSVHAFRLALAEKEHKLSSLSATMVLQAKAVVDLETALDHARDASTAMVTRHEEEKLAYAASIATHQAAGLAIRQKLGSFFTRQSDRQLLKNIVREWAITAKCLRAWAESRAHRISLRVGIEVMTKLAMKQSLFFMLSSWKERVAELKLESQVRQQQLIQQAWENRLTQTKRDLNFQRECFTGWHQIVLHKRKCAIVVKKCIARLKNGSLARVLGSWRDFVECRKTQRDLLRRWISRCRTSVLQRAWSRWQRQIVLKEQQYLILRLQDERDTELKQLKAEFNEYQRTQQALLEEVKNAQTEQEYALKETEARLQEEARQVQRFSGAIKALFFAREKESTRLRFFKAWHKVVRRSVRNRRVVQALQIKSDARQMFVVLNSWGRFTIQQKRLRAVFITVKGCFTRWWQIQTFDAWKEAKRRSKAVQKFSSLFARNLELFVCRDIFSAWKKIARKNNLLRRTLEQIWLGSVHAKMRQQFAHWVKFTKALAAKEQVEKRNVALTAIRAKVWWKQSMSTMRFCFSEWKTTVTFRKRQRHGERNLALFQQKRVISICFSAWVEFVVTNVREGNRSHVFARWLHKVVRRKLRRAMALWKVVIIRDQLHELLELKELRLAHQEQLQLQREEISLLMLTATETKRKLVDVTDIHDASTTKLLYLTECGLVAKYFNALKLKVMLRRYQLRAIHFCHKNARRRQLAELFSSWYSFSQNCRAMKFAVAEKIKRRHDVLTRAVIHKWHSLANRHRVLTQKQLKLQQRIRTRIIKDRFAEWQQSVYRDRNVRIAMDLLTAITERLKLKIALLSWHQKCLDMRRQSLKKQEKHRKIMQFLMGRQEEALVQTFHSWKDIVQSKKVARSQAQQRYSKKAFSVLSSSWHEWCSTVRTIKRQRQSIICMHIIAKRYYYRVAMSRWRNYRFKSQIALLKSGNNDLISQVAESSRHLQSASMTVDQLSMELTELQNKLVKAESTSSAVALEVSTQEASRNRYLDSLRALNKIMLKQTISIEVSKAFMLWKSLLLIIQRKQRALVTIANIRQRRKRLFAFWLWKVKTLRWRELDSLKTLWGRNNRLAIILRWRKFSSTQAKLRLFLTKRCLVAYSNQCLPLSFAFRLWKTKAAEVAGQNQISTLCAKLRAEQDSSSALFRRLALGKWCWIAYHHRIRQMRAFLSRCYANSTKNNIIRHRRAIEEMQANSDAAIAKVKEQSEAKTLEDMGALSAAEEQLTTGASFQALHTLIRRLFQPTTVKELFVSVASTFAQIIHGSAAVLFLFDPSSNELWTQREENQLIQVPASLGIAGSTLSSGSTLIISDITTDPRFHPMVDQFVLSSLRQDDVTPTLMMASARPTVHAAKSTIGVVSSALVSADGNVYLAQMDLLIVKLTGECITSMQELYMLESKLREVLNERDQLVSAKAELQKRYQHVQDKLESSERNTKDFTKLVVDWKKKLAKWQKVIDEKDRAIAEKTSELENVEKEFDHFRREQRSKQLQSVLNSSSLRTKSATRLTSTSSQLDEYNQSPGKAESLSDRGQISILRADQTRLKSQLVRAEADNLLLVKAISIARTQHGELPRTIQAEVTRVATRVSRRAPSEA